MASKSRWDILGNKWTYCPWSWWVESRKKWTLLQYIVYGALQPQFGQGAMLTNVHSQKRLWWASELNHGAMEEVGLVWWTKFSFTSCGWPGGVCVTYLGKRCHQVWEAGKGLSLLTPSTEKRSVGWSLRTWRHHTPAGWLRPQLCLSFLHCLSVLLRCQLSNDME